MESESTVAGAAFIARLLGAVRHRDLDALTACFAEDYRNETPAHPARNFVGRAQVRRNWEQIFAAVPDLAADATAIADEQSVWSEWEMRGTRRDGKPHLMRGVVIFGLRAGDAAWARFYLEPVDQGRADVNEAVRQALTANASSTLGPRS
jgi:ketosteroid isomerase-like protein